MVAGTSSAVTIAWTIDWQGGIPDSGATTRPYTQLVAEDTTPTGTTRSCVAVSSLGMTTGTTTAFRIDRTKPTVTSGAAQRPADREGWFNRPLQVGFTGSDAASGIASCTSASYGGPDSASASVGGTCRDAAGNVSAPSSFALKYDATAPQVAGLAPDRPADAFGYFLRPVALAFTGSDATSGLLGCDTVTYAGPDSPAGPVTGSCRDVAGNSAARTLAVAFDATAPSLTKVKVLSGDSVATLSWERSADAKTVRVRRRPGAGPDRSSRAPRRPSRTAGCGMERATATR